MNNIGYLGFLSLLFIGLKLGGAITWSWWWVLLPLYAPAAIVIVMIPFALLFFVVNNKNIKGRAK